jgi:hypothetical protein
MFICNLEELLEDGDLRILTHAEQIEAETDLL